MNSRTISDGIAVVLMVTVLATGVFLRLPSNLFSEGALLVNLQFLHLQSGFTQIGFDENLYRGYVDALSQSGV